MIAQDETITGGDPPFPEDFLEAAVVNKRSARHLKKTVKHRERSWTLEALEKTGHQQTKAAGQLAISNRLLRHKPKEDGMKKPEP